MHCVFLGCVDADGGNGKSSDHLDDHTREKFLNMGDTTFHGVEMKC